MTGMRPADIGALTQAGELTLSPDGTLVAFTVVGVDMAANNYTSRIWMGPVADKGAPRPFSSGEHRDGLPRWSPDGTLLAFVSHRDDEGSQVMVLPVTGGGEALKVVSWSEEVNELAWSPDGSRLAFVARDRDEATYGEPGESFPEAKMPPRRINHLYSRLDSVGWIADRPNRLFVVPADGTGSPRPLTVGPFPASDVAWSPDGRRLAFASARHDSWDIDLVNDLWHVGADGRSEPVRITDTTSVYRMPAWSPDGTRLACLRNPTPLDQPRHTQVEVIDLGTGRHQVLSAGLDRNCAPYPGLRAPLWDHDDVLFAAEDGGNVHLFRADCDGQAEVELIVAGERWVSSWDAAGGTVAFVASTPVTLSEVLIADDDRQLTGFSAAFTVDVQLTAPERFVAISSDGAEVECWAMAPSGPESGRRYPTLLNVHGGPYAQYGNRFFDEFHMQVGAGFGVLYCNPRGSSGYSEAWARAIRWPEAVPDPGSGWGGVDYDDVLAAAEEACRRFAWVDPDRLGVMGGSYGGYMASWVIGHTSRFKAACSERACNDLLALEQSSDIATSFRSYVGRSHVDDPEPYIRQSPITYVKEMITPVLIVHSENDLRCPIHQAEELFVALRLLGRHAEMVRFPGESHELTRSGSPQHRVMRAELILDWFNERL